MAIPKYSDMFGPVLTLAAKSEVTRPMVTEGMSQRFGLSDEDRATRIPSGAATLIASRTGWAITFLTKAKLLERVAPKRYRTTELGAQVLAQNGGNVTVKHLEALPGWEDAWKSKHGEDKKSVDEQPSAPEHSQTPTETLDQALTFTVSALRTQLLESILAQTPSFFEYLVLDVLVAMGYGGSRRDAATHMGKANDEGIDGCINQDSLGLDKIYVQAKRYATDQTIGRGPIQGFVGALTGKGVTKGIFITTSNFAHTAEEFVTRGSHMKVVLIDGEQLVDLMMRYKIGVRVERAVELLALDQNYFLDED